MVYFWCSWLKSKMKDFSYCIRGKLWSAVLFSLWIIISLPSNKTLVLKTAIHCDSGFFEVCSLPKSKHHFPKSKIQWKTKKTSDHLSWGSRNRRIFLRFWNIPSLLSMSSADTSVSGMMGAAQEALQWAGELSGVDHCSVQLWWVYLGGASPGLFSDGFLLPLVLFVLALLCSPFVWHGVIGCGETRTDVAWCDWFLGDSPLIWTVFLQIKRKMNFHKVI